MSIKDIKIYMIKEEKIFIFVTRCFSGNQDSLGVEVI